jgi:hypothetical protein
MDGQAGRDEHEEAAAQQVEAAGEDDEQAHRDRRDDRADRPLPRREEQRAASGGCGQRDPQDREGTEHQLAGRAQWEARLVAVGRALHERATELRVERDRGDGHAVHDREQRRHARIVREGDAAEHRRRRSEKTQDRERHSRRHEAGDEAEQPQAPEADRRHQTDRRAGALDELARREAGGHGQEQPQEAQHPDQRSSHRRRLADRRIDPPT